MTAATDDRAERTERAGSRRRTDLVVWVALMVLLAATMAVSLFQLGALNVILNLGIAVAKAVLIGWFYMHLRGSTGMTRLFSIAVLFWLAVMFGLTLNDYISRGWYNTVQGPEMWRHEGSPIPPSRPGLSGR